MAGFVTAGAPAETARWTAYGEECNVMVIDARRWRVVRDVNGTDARRGMASCEAVGLPAYSRQKAAGNGRVRRQTGEEDG
jgi:hypothetical protein